MSANLKKSGKILEKIYENYQPIFGKNLEYLQLEKFKEIRKNLGRLHSRLV